jgi:dihydrolipoamide dehydrogenase
MGIKVDVVVLGAGPGGYVAAIRAAQLGKQVLIIEKEKVGGVCLNRGCIPSKSLISAAHRFEEVAYVSGIGIEIDGYRVDFEKVQRWKDGIIHKLTSGVSSLLKGNQVDIMVGEGRFVGPNELEVVQYDQVERVHFDYGIIATGSRPIELKSFPFGNRVLSSSEALSLSEIPNRLLVIGGGYIGVELGQTFAKFGSKVTIIEGSDQILPLFEPEVVRWVQRKLKKDGAEIITKAKAISAVQTDDEITLQYEINGKEHAVTADYLLVTVGRKPNTDGLGLEELGIQKDEHGLIQVNTEGRTTLPHIFAIGDAVVGPALAHKASYEGKIAAEVVSGLPSKITYTSIPSIVFSDPEISSVGLSEKEAKAIGHEVVIGKFNYAANGRALSLNANEGFVKVIGEKETGTLLGAQIVGPGASDLITELGLAIENQLKLEDIAKTIHAHPTLGEMVAEAVENALGHGVHTILK